MSWTVGLDDSVIAHESAPAFVFLKQNRIELEACVAAVSAKDHGTCLGQMHPAARRWGKLRSDRKVSLTWTTITIRAGIKPTCKMAGMRLPSTAGKGGQSRFVAGTGGCVLRLAEGVLSLDGRDPRPISAAGVWFGLLKFPSASSFWPRLA